MVWEAEAIPPFTAILEICLRAPIDLITLLADLNIAFSAE